MRNFNFPYFSRDIAEFWRRWHISLTTWFRDYIYIPLGGSRVTKLRVVINTMVIFLVSGFWHGANWTFVAWGAYHALLFLPLILLGTNRRNTDIIAKGKLLPSCKEFVGMLLTFVLVVFGWIIFRAENITQAYEYVSGIFSLSLFDTSFAFKTRAFKGIFILLIVEWLQRDKQHAMQLPNNKLFSYGFVRYILYFTLIFFVYYYNDGGKTDFIYFQF